MPVIHFDCLIDPAGVSQLEQRIAALTAVMQRRGVLTDLHYTAEEHPQLATEVIAQLRESYLRDHDLDSDDAPAAVLEQWMPWRFRFQPAGYQGSFNQLAMQLSRLWTPPAQLPHDALALTQEQRFEVAARYPWTVHIQPG